MVVATEYSIGETHIEGRKMTAGVRGLYLGSASSWSRAGKALRP